MGERPGPGSSGRPDGGLTLGDLDQYGVGERNPVTGLYSAYNLPDGHPAEGREEGDYPPPTWAELLDCFELIVPDFASEYQVRLTVARRSMGWCEFRSLLFGLLAADTRLARHFRAKRNPEDEQPEGGDEHGG